MFCQPLLENQHFCYLLILYIRLTVEQIIFPGLAERISIEIGGILHPSL